MKADKIIMHNGVSFDLPVINSLLNCNIPYSKAVDTYLIAQLYNPIIENGNSLDSWGERFGLPKIKFDDWSGWSPAMETYCKRDVDITEQLYNYFSSKPELFSKRSVDLEHVVRKVINDQQNNGFFLDMPKASVLLATLSDEAGMIHDEMQEIFEPTIKQLKTKTKIIPFNPQSRQQTDRDWETH